jgi:hypothetical protein
MQRPKEMIKGSSPSWNQSKNLISTILSKKGGPLLISYCETINCFISRYPTFSHALKDLDDALCLCFAFSSLTRSKIARPSLIDACRRLTIEFLHYVIESNSLKKVQKTN